MVLLTVGDTIDGVAQFFTVIVIFILVLAVTLGVTRWIGKYQSRISTGNNIEVLESVRISPQSYAEILRIGKKYVAVAVCKEKVTLLCELDKEELDFSKTEEQVSFAGILSQIVKTDSTIKTDSTVNSRPQSGDDKDDSFNPTEENN